MIVKAFVGATALALLFSLNPVPASATQSTTCASGVTEGQAAAKPKKKKGFGLGGILKAAKDAGVGNMLGAGNLLGDGTAGQIAGAVAGTAISASEGGGVNVSGTVGSLAGSGRAAQIAGAVTGTAAQLAQSSPTASGGAKAAKPCTPAPAKQPAVSTWK